MPLYDIFLRNGFLYVSQCISAFGLCLLARVAVYLAERWHDARGFLCLRLCSCGEEKGNHNGMMKRSEEENED